jgi:hypothetical protein
MPTEFRLNGKDLITKDIYLKPAPCKHCDKDRGVGIERYVIKFDYIRPLKGKV